MIKFFFWSGISIRNFKIENRELVSHFECCIICKFQGNVTQTWWLLDVLPTYCFLFLVFVRLLNTVIISMISRAYLFYVWPKLMPQCCYWLLFWYKLIGMLAQGWLDYIQYIQIIVLVEKRLALEKSKWKI